MRQQRMTILAVDDEPSVLIIMRLMLERAGYRVLTATSAHLAMKLAVEYSDSIQLLLLDVIMPDLRGPELQERLRCCLRNPDIPTVYVSGYQDVFCDPDLSVLEKPFTREALVEFIGLALKSEARPASTSCLSAWPSTLHS